MLDQFLSHIQHGIDHVLNINTYDHILFLIVLTIPYVFKDWKRVLSLVTIFVIGHVISLTFATYNVISVNKKWITFLIPLTILIIALFNVFTAGKKAQNEKAGILFFATLFFGLIHGFSFVEMFESTIGVSGNKFISLLGNALGFEIGQLIIAFVIVFVGFLRQTLFRFNKRDWVLVISAIVIGLLIPLLIKSNIFT